jgi:hypothetical protein
MNEDGLEHIFSGEPQPEVKLDVVQVQEFRRRVLGAMFARQVELLLPHRPNIDPKSMTYAELLEVVRQNDELEDGLTLQAATRRAEREAYWQVIRLIDDMENEAIKQADD